MKFINMQWHITDICNLRCSHCYQESYEPNDLSYDQLLYILYQYDELINRLHKESGQKVISRITLTGGEPLLYEKFFDLLNHIKAKLSYVKLSILTNGTLIDKPTAKLLKSFNLHFVQVSLEGDKNKHDSIRGKGSFALAKTGIKNLVNEGIKVTISFTAHKANYKSIPELAKICRKYKVFSLWSDRLIPYGSGENLKDLLLTKEETKEYVSILNKEKHKKIFFSKTFVSTERALQFLTGNQRIYRCNAGNGLITVDANGTLYPCRRMPIKIGNLLKDNLSELYYTNPIMAKLRNPEIVPDGCEKCQYSKSCNGGLKCLSYALTGNPFVKDPGCWL